PLMRTYLSAARAGDSLALAASSDNPEPVARTLSMARVAPARTDSLIKTLRLKFGESVVRDEATILFGTGVHPCGFNDSPDPFYVRLVRHKGHWLVATVGFGVC